jgi:phosphinothricin acetyltransferase
MPTTIAASYTIDEMHPTDGDQVLAIYHEGIATGDATFETETPPWDQWDKTHLQHSRLVARAGPHILGWAALSPVSDRCAYGGVAEISVYVSRAARGQGVGSRLLTVIIGTSERAGIWTLQAGIFPENHASITIHLRAGFREVGRRERLGKLKGAWRDVVMLERRSRVAGK